MTGCFVLYCKQGIYTLWGERHITVTNAALAVRGCWLHEIVAVI